jgi:crossover junction endodeoxyribonuclease RusA
VEQSLLPLSDPVEVELTWPPAGLFPNRARTQSWRKNGKLAALYRRECWILMKASKAHGRMLKVRFHPPDKRIRDDDGMIAAFKAGRDGVADALQVDDRHFRPQYEIGEPVKWGKVIVTIGEV